MVPCCSRDLPAKKTYFIKGDLIPHDIILDVQVFFKMLILLALIKYTIFMA